MAADDPTAPQPLTGDELQEIHDSLTGEERAWCDGIYAWDNRLRTIDHIRALQAEVARLEDEVDRLTANLATTTSQLGAAESVTHRCPPIGASVTPCCGRTPFDLLPTDRITVDPDLVTCAGALARAAQPQEVGDD